MFRELQTGEDAGIRIQAAGLSDRGLKRGHNEDSLSVVPDIGLYIVADGMGGHNAGEVASRQAIESIVEFVRTSTASDVTWPFPAEPGLSELENTLVSGIKVANRDVCNLSLEHAEYSGMGTTLVALLIDPGTNRLAIAHVGDSRCYLLREGEIEQLTLDHSWVSEQLQKKIITAEEAKNHRWKNVITRALGNKLDVEVDVQSRALRTGDTYLLCSDGLSGMVDDAAMRAILLKHPDLETAVRELIQAANANGGLDNISVILVRFLGVEDSRDRENETRA
ncbi:MAG: Stp1/IreP family PP2C-type Ser/Thr phosphatase [Candidatus Sumerlaeia bacterium]|nr:Stp1/IreP family PP2C-type Ser/Thr phosphatase [Candidatus Sumerlaeia bacterium]